MTHLLGSGARARLRAFASCRGVVLFDFDGTLAPIVTDRELARMRRRTHALLTRVCALYPCAVVSGRSLLDTRNRLEGVPVQIAFGSHGLEPGPNLPRYQRMMARVQDEIVQQLAPFPWLDVEDKRYSLAIHFRSAANRSEARQHVLAAVARIETPIRIVEGKCVVNIVPKDSPHKGEAVLAIQQHFGAEDVLYVGDDVTDEDAFRYVATRSWLGVRVGKSERTAANYYLRRQREIDLLLARLIRLRYAEKRAQPAAICAE